MKRLLLATLIIIGCFIATTGNAQVYVQARVNLGLPLPRVYCAPPPPPVVVYNEPVYTEPVYTESVPAPVYYDRGCERPVVVRRGYERVRYNDYYYKRNNREYYERDERGNGHGHGGWKHQRQW